MQPACETLPTQHNMLRLPSWFRPQSDERPQICPAALLGLGMNLNTTAHTAWYCTATNCTVMMYCYHCQCGKSSCAQCLPVVLLHLQVIFMTGWAPSAKTPKAAERGSATISFKEMATALAERGALAGSVGDGEGSDDVSSSSSSSSSDDNRDDKWP